MSSYLNIYLLPKVDETNKEPKKLLYKSVSRSSDLYQAFYESNIAYAYGQHNFGEPEESEKDVQYTKITYEVISSICESVYVDMIKTKNRIEEYEKHANGNADIIEEIIEMKSYYREQESLYHEIKCLQSFIYDLENFDWYGFEGVYANID